MEELENGNTKANEEPKPEIEIPVPVENEEANKEILITEAVADDTEPLASYSEEGLNYAITEVDVEDEKGPELGKTNEVSCYPVDETGETVLLDIPDVNIGASSNIGEENISILENSKNVEDEDSAPVHTEDREIQPPPVSANPSLAQRTSWGGCCGLFQFLRRSND